MTDADDSPRTSAWTWMLTAILALVVVAWNLRGFEVAGPVFTDAARHAMNGVFLHDLVAEGRIADAKVFATDYYRRLPALSLPNHPPVFPACEAVAFGVAGVSGHAAILVVAIFNAIAVVLFFRLAMATTSCAWVATAATIPFFFHGQVQKCASDTMLELPTLAFILAAILCLVGPLEKLSWFRGILYGVLASIALWTKQNAILLIVVPWAFAIFTRRWRWLVSPPLWIASFLPAISLILLIAFSRMVEVNSLTNQATPASEIIEIARHHLVYYATAVVDEFGLPGALLLAGGALGGLVGLMIRKDRGTALLMAWFCSSVAMLLSIGAFDRRYALFAYPPVIILGYAAAKQLACLLHCWPVLRWTIVAASILFAQQSLLPATYAQGPEAAARLVVTGEPTRVLYCGKMDGTFIFRIRALDPLGRTTIIRGDKFGDDVYANSFESTLRRYGIRYVVMEADNFPGPWLRVVENPPPQLHLVAQVPLKVSPYRWNGTLMIYRFEGTFDDPVADVPVRFTFFGAQDSKEDEK